MIFVTRHEAYNKHHTGSWAKSAPSGDRTTPPSSRIAGSGRCVHKKGFLYFLWAHERKFFDEKGFLSGNFFACGGPQTVPLAPRDLDPTNLVGDPHPT